MPFLFYVLMTWTTRERQALITEKVAAFLKEILPGIAMRYGANLLETGVVNDHVHVLIRLPVRYDIPRLAQGLKGASARLVNQNRIASRDQPLRWAQGYDVRTVSPRSLNHAREYVRGQLMRHPDRIPRP
jgi:REP element-mobilizing transposase RayT